MAFRAEIRRALATPVGAKLSQVFYAPRVTVLVADAQGGERDVMALSELADALVRVGTARGRQMTILAGADRPGDALRERARMLRATLGMPVVVHDPGAASPYSPGSVESVGPLGLDDELREAEAVVVVGRFSRGMAGAMHGGPALLLPGLADADTRERFRKAGAGDALSFAVLDHVEVDFALVWDSGDPSRARAGAGRETLLQCVAEGWLAPPVSPRAQR